MDFKFDEKFEEILTEELEAFGIESSSIEIKYALHNSLLTIPSPIDPDADEYVVRMEVVGYEGEIPDVDDYIDKWFRSCVFIYNMTSRNVNDSTKIDMMDYGRGTIKSIATKICNVFKNSCE